jgi:hypothetical protein
MIAGDTLNTALDFLTRLQRFVLWVEWVFLVN